LQNYFLLIEKFKILKENPIAKKISTYLEMAFGGVGIS
jgi:hypothetical protein